MQLHNVSRSSTKAWGVFFANNLAIEKAIAGRRRHKPDRPSPNELADELRL